MKKNYFVFFIFISSSVFAQILECATNDTSYNSMMLYKKNAAIINKQTEVPGRLPIKNIPVQIHLFKTSSGACNITLEQLRNEIDSVNSFYANAGIHLFECFPPEIIMIDSVYNYSNLQQNYILNNHYTPNVVNLYYPNTISFFGTIVCGYSSQPPSSDYVFIEAPCAKNGTTLAHELGHYFGLAHTHTNINNIQEFVNGTNCSTGGDLLCDTPADPNLSGKVNTSCWYTGNAVDPNNTPYQPNAYQLMSYSRHNCRNQFSPMQYSLMNYTMLHERNNLKCTNTTSIVDNNSILNSISIFPNPTKFEVNLSIPDNYFANIKIVNVQGKEMYSANKLSKQENIDISALKNGYYIVKFELISSDSSADTQLISKPLIIIN